MISIKTFTSVFAKIYVISVKNIPVYIPVRQTVSNSRKSISPSPMKAAWNAEVVRLSAMRKLLTGSCHEPDLAYATSMDKKIAQRSKIWRKD